MENVKATNKQFNQGLFEWEKKKRLFYRIGWSVKAKMRSVDLCFTQAKQ